MSSGAIRLYGDGCPVAVVCYHCPICKGDYCKVPKGKVLTEHGDKSNKSGDLAVCELTLLTAIVAPATVCIVLNDSAYYWSNDSRTALMIRVAKWIRGDHTAFIVVPLRRLFCCIACISSAALYEALLPIAGEMDKTTAPRSRLITDRHTHTRDGAAAAIRQRIRRRRPALTFEFCRRWHRKHRCRC